MTSQEKSAQITALHSGVEAVCPIFGISIGRWDDRSTWSIQFRPEATPEQQKAGMEILKNLDLSKVVAPPTAEEKVAALEARIVVLEKGVAP